MTVSVATQPDASPLGIVEDIPTLRRAIAERRQRGECIGLVPTMGALHAGHLSLIQQARRECGCVVVSVFVNPTQFGPGEDFERYPRPFDDDAARCREAGVDLLFHPTTADMYPPQFATCVDVAGLSEVWEGACRPGHFRGVATVVLKLLNVVRPDVAYFGRKDYQQQVLVRRMCRDLDLDVDIRVGPTVREADGLALSSRNRYLTPAERQSALSLYRSLKLAEQRLLGGERNLAAVRASMRQLLEATPHVRVDYATVAHPETLEELDTPQPAMIALVAARVGTTRLIDNLPIVMGQ